MEEKLIELEIKLSYQEDLLADLNQIVIVQQTRLDDLMRELGSLKEQLQEAISSGAGQGAANENERPPHY